VPYPDYTTTECDEAIVAIDAEIARLRPLADAYSLGGGRHFAQGQKVQRLQAERSEWVARKLAAEGSGAPLQFECELT
jgi:uncharacterized small protein (DUF1192 family)